MVPIRSGLVCPTRVDSSNWSDDHAAIEHDGFAGNSHTYFDTKLIPSPSTPDTPNVITVRAQNGGHWAQHLVFYCCPPPPPPSGCSSAYLADDIVFVFDETASVSGAELASAHEFAINLITAFDTTAQVYDPNAEGPHVGVVTFAQHAVQHMGFTSSAAAKVEIKTMGTVFAERSSGGAIANQLVACPGNAMKKVLELLATSRPLASTLVVFITDSMGSDSGCAEKANRVALLQQLRTTADRILAVGVNPAILGPATEPGIDHAWLLSLSKISAQQKWPHLTPRSANSFKCSHAEPVHREVCNKKTLAVLKLIGLANPAETFLSIWTPAGSYTGANQADYNVNAPSSALYMHLDVDYAQFKDSSGKMTMQLRYPELTPSTLTWKQTSSPLEYAVTGFEIEPDLEAHHWDGAGDFRGMCRSSSLTSFLDGQAGHRQWWFAVGSYVPFGGSWIPGPRSTGDANVQGHENGHLVKQVEFWVKNVANNQWTLLVRQDSRPESGSKFFPSRGVHDSIPSGCSVQTFADRGAQFKTSTPPIDFGGQGIAPPNTPYQALCEAPYISVPNFADLLRLDLTMWVQHHACRTSEPTMSPTFEPTAAPTTSAPSLAPTAIPTMGPSFSGTCTSLEASACDATNGECYCADQVCATKSCRCRQGFGCDDSSCSTCTTQPTAAPTWVPSAAPTSIPTVAPTASPTATPSIWGLFGAFALRCSSASRALLRSARAASHPRIGRHRTFPPTIPYYSSLGSDRRRRAGVARSQRPAVGGARRRRDRCRTPRVHHHRCCHRWHRRLGDAHDGRRRHRAEDDAQDR
jgi:hypothetical protein